MFKNRLIYSFFVAVMVAILFAIDLQYIVTYAQMSSLFLFESDYAIQHLNGIALPVKYITDFIVQFFYYPTLGAVIIGLMYGLSFYCITSSAKNRDPLMVAVPLFVYLLMSYFDAGFMQLTTVLLLCSVAMKLWSVANYTARLVITIPLAALLYYCVGMYYLIVVIFMIARLVSDAPQKRYILIYVLPLTLIMAIIPYCISYIFLFPLDKAYSIELKSWMIAAAVAYVLYTTVPPVKWFDSMVWKWVSMSLFIIFVGGGWVAISNTLNDDMRNIMKMEQAAAEEQWDEVLRLNRESPSLKTRLKNYLTNVALFRKGVLIEQLLDYDQSQGEKGLFFQWEPSSNVVINNNDLVYANVGLINEAFRYCFESWEGRKVHTNYRKLITYSELLGRDDFADKFKRKLDKSLFYADDEGKLKFQLGSVVKCDESYVINNFAGDLRAILAADSTNYAAFDYLAANYLLSNQISQLSKIIPRAIERYEGKLPVVYDEALMVLSVVNPEQFQILNYTIPEAVVKRFEGFNRTVFGSNSANPRASAENSYGNSYWFYLSFVSPYGSDIR